MAMNQPARRAWRAGRGISGAVLASLVFAGLIVVPSAPALAWTPPAVGASCKGLRGRGPAVERIAGNFLGGRRVRHGIVDRKSYQGCFASVSSCERWLARLSRHHPLGPGFATCTAVTLR